MNRTHLWMLATTLAFLWGCYVRVAPRTSFVFTADGVNLQETDAWYHARVVEGFVQSNPAPALIDPFISYPNPQGVPVGPVLDTLVAAFVRLTGVHPHVAAAWCPVLLWLMLIISLAFLVRHHFSDTEACLAIILASTLPGHFLLVSSLGFHDHHILEALLYVLILLFISKQQSLAAGLALTLYLLTFLGGAVLIVFLGFWRLSAPSAPSLWRAYLLAFVLLLPFRQMLWMEYSLTSLAAALLLEVLYKFVPKPSIRWSAIAFASVLATIAAWKFGVFHLAAHFTVGKGSATVAEMHSLTLESASKYFGLALPLAAIGIWQLLRSAKPLDHLVLVTGLGFATTGLFQTRLSYYIAVAVALLGARAISVIPQRLNAAIVTLIVLPNLWFGHELASEDHGLTTDWRQALAWMRTNTPEPLIGGSAYPNFRSASRPFRFQDQAYGVLAWWDFGYAITTLAHRIPFTNPTQNNATAAARVFLASSEADLNVAMRKYKLRYFIVGADIPMLKRNEGLPYGKFPNIIEWANQRQETYFENLDYVSSEGKTSRIQIYYPAYYRTPAIRLALFGTEEYIPQSGVCLARIENKVIRYLECFNSESEAAAAQVSLPGTIVIGTNPLRSCVRLEAWTGLEPVFSSSEKVALLQDRWMHSLCIYQLKNN